VDGHADTYWASEDAVTTPEVSFQLARETLFSIVRIREAIALGQRVSAFAVDAWLNGAWKEIGSGSSIGMAKILRMKQAVKTTKVRLRITDSPVYPALSEFALFSE
jgi:alpha-L-fucosidase